MFKGVLDHLHVAEVLVHEALFLAICRDDLGEAKLENGKRVLELAIFGLWVFGGRRRCVIIDLVFFFLFVKFFLVALNLGLEVILVLLVLRPQSNSLVNLLLCQTLAEQGRTVLLESLLVHLLSQVLEAPRLTVLVHDLLPKHIDFLFVLLVLSLGLIEAELLVFASVFLPIKANVVPLVIHGFGFYLADIFLLFG